MADSEKSSSGKVSSEKSGSDEAALEKGGSEKADHHLDAKGLSCPLPILNARKALAAIAAGETLEVEATDAGSVADFAAFCRTTGNELLESSQNGGAYTFLIRKPA